MTSQSWQSDCNRCGKHLYWNRREDLRNPQTGKMRPYEDEGYSIAHSCKAPATPATAGTIFEQKPATAAAPPAPARDTNNSDAILERIVALLRDISSDTQRIARKLDETFARLDERVQEARAK